VFNVLFTSLDLTWRTTLRLESFLNKFDYLNEKSNFFVVARPACDCCDTREKLKKNTKTQSEISRRYQFNLPIGNSIGNRNSVFLLHVNRAVLFSFRSPSEMNDAIYNIFFFVIIFCFLTVRNLSCRRQVSVKIASRYFSSIPVRGLEKP
jgi:hypothetical protein